jgi:hypothetical protein
MSTERDLTRLYDALGTETQYAPLAPPEVLRRRGDRRTRSRAAVAVAAVAVLVAGVAVGGNVLLGRGGSRVEPAPPLPTPSPSVSSSASPSVSPSASPSATQPTSPPSPALADDPGPIPAAAFVREVSGGTSPERYLPSLCRASIPDKGLVRRRALEGFLLEDPAAAVAPVAILAESVAVYRTPGDAQSWVELLASRTGSCPSEAIDSGTIRYRALPDAPRVGDGSFVIEQRIPATELATGKPTGGYWTFYTAVVRHRDTVAVLYTHPYEDWGVDDPQLIFDVMRHAYEVLAAWRG